MARSELTFEIKADARPALREIQRVKRHLWAAKIGPIGWFGCGYLSALLAVAVGWWVA